MTAARDRYRGRFLRLVVWLNRNQPWSGHLTSLDELLYLHLRTSCVGCESGDSCVCCEPKLWRAVCATSRGLGSCVCYERELCKLCLLLISCGSCVHCMRQGSLMYVHHIYATWPFPRACIFHEVSSVPVLHQSGNMNSLLMN